MDHYQLCDTILKECQGLNDFTIDRLCMLYTEKDRKSLTNAVMTLKNDGFVRNTSSLFHHHITGEGVEFSKNGGYEEKANREKSVKGLQDTKLKLDVLNAERVYQTYWWTFWMAAAALGISLALLLLRLAGK